MKLSFAVLLIVGFGASLLLAQEERDPASVPEEEMEKLLIHRVDPVLPPDPEVPLRGTVVLKAVISKTGAIESLQAMSGHPMLVPAAVDAAKQWKYRHYEVNGIPARVETTIRVALSEPGEAVNETSDQQVQSPVLVAAEDMQDHLVYKVAPLYPPLARQARIQGAVILRIVIDKLGAVRATQLVSGHPMLAPSAIDAVKKWKYIPFESDGRPVEFQTDVQVIFKLAGS